MSDGKVFQSVGAAMGMDLNALHFFKLYCNVMHWVPTLSKTLNNIIEAFF